MAGDNWNAISKGQKSREIKKGAVTLKTRFFSKKKKAGMNVEEKRRNLYVGGPLKD